MNKYAFLGYPLSFDLLYKFDPKLKKYPKSDIKKILEETQPVLASKITGVKSLTGKEIEGDFIVLMLLPEQILELDTQFVLEKIISAGKLAAKNGASIIGLGGLTSIIGNQGEIVAKNLNIAVTTGNTYTAASTIEATLKAAKLMGIELSNANAVIVGATGSIGSACSYILSEKVKTLTLVARNQQRLEEFANFLKIKSSATINASSNINKAISGADIVIAVTSAPTAIINPKNLKSGSVVCDVAVPRNVSENYRDDLLIIDGGLIYPPGDLHISFDIGLPEGTAYACLCETMILALEGRFENYSLGRGLSLDKVKEMSQLAKKHGFKIDSFKSFGKTIDQSFIDSIKANVIKKKG